MSEVEDELAALGRFEQGLATARSAVDQLALTGDLTAADASMLLLGLSALDARTAQARRSVSALGQPLK